MRTWTNLQMISLLMLTSLSSVIENTVDLSYNVIGGTE